jgi:hypothetical protein
LSALAEADSVPTLSIAELEREVGSEVGLSPWCTIDQKPIDAFADVTFIISTFMSIRSGRAHRRSAGQSHMAS